MMVLILPYACVSISGVRIFFPLIYSANLFHFSGLTRHEREVSTRDALSVLRGNDAAVIFLLLYRALHDFYKCAARRFDTFHA